MAAVIAEMEHQIRTRDSAVVRQAEYPGGENNADPVGQDQRGVLRSGPHGRIAASHHHAVRIADDNITAESVLAPSINRVENIGEIDPIKIHAENG